MADAERATQLRDDLKAWEKQFAAANGGRKASRDDIKADAAIAAKYKAYSKLKAPASAKPPNPAPAAPPRTPRKPVPPPSTTQQPQPGSPTPSLLLGPTPQKDGRVLGLFDAVPGSTPRKPLAGLSHNAAPTPSRAARDRDCARRNPGRRLSRTPQSAGKRFVLDALVTPVKAKRGLDREDGGGGGSAGKRIRTPAFLRRGGGPAVGDEAGAVRLGGPWGGVGVGRGLSAMIRELRRREEEVVEEEVEVLREMEREGAAAAAGEMVGAAMPVGGEDVAVAKETQVDEFADDLDLEALIEMEDSMRQNRRSGGECEQLQSQSQPQSQPRQWKKKGQKRTTRRVMMRPVQPFARPKPAETPIRDDSHASDAGSDDDDDDDAHVPADDDLDGSDSSGDENAASNAARKRKQAKTGKIEVKAKDKKQPNKAKSKINPNAAAHANFRTLKIKNKNSKAKGRGRGRRR